MDNGLKLRRLEPKEQQEAKRVFNEGVRLNKIIPFKTPNGVIVTHLNCFCNACSKPIDSACVSVKETKVYSTQIFECIGICRGCSCMTEFLFRFHSSGYIDTLVGAEWKLIHVYKSEPKKLKWWDLVGYLQYIFLPFLNKIQKIKRD